MRGLVLIRGAGDLATGVAHRLYRSGFLVVMTEIAQPTVIRRPVSFAEAVYEGARQVEGVTSRLAGDLDEARATLLRGEIPVLVDETAEKARRLRPLAVVDAILAKRNTGTGITDAPLVIGLGPGFTAGVDVHAVVETKRGHDLGRVLLDGGAAPNTGVPGEIDGYAAERLIRSPACGIFEPCVEIGSLVTAGDLLGQVDGCPVRPQISGALRGLIRGGIAVDSGQKIGDVDPRGRVGHCYTISDKARAIGGGVLEAVLMLGGGRFPA